MFFFSLAHNAADSLLISRRRFCCWKLWQIKWLNFLLKFLTQYILLLNQSLISTFCNSTTPFTTLPIKRIQVFLPKPFDLSLRYIYFKKQRVQKKFCGYFNTQRQHWGIDIVFTKKIGSAMWFFTSLWSKNCQDIKNIVVFTSKPCLIHKCLIATWTWMAQLSCWSVLNISCSRSIK